MGRKTSFTPEIADQILSRLEQGIPLEEICRTEGMPKSRTVHEWVKEWPKFGAAYARARADGYDVIAADCLRIADESTRDTIQTENGPKMDTEFVARSKLRIETRLRLLRSWNPKKYGDHIAIETTEAKPQRTREEILLELRESGLRVSDVFQSLTQKAEPAGEVLEIGDVQDAQVVDDSDDLSGLES